MTQTSRYPEAAQLFALDTARHTMTVRHDDDLYRHIAFRAPDTNLYWFDLVTWPGALCFNGDMGTYVFARVTDMFTFFSGPGDINPGYWGEKVQGNGDARDKGVKAWSPALFRQHVTEVYADFGRHAVHAAELWRAIEEGVLVHEEDEHAAITAAIEFEFMDPAERNKTAFVFPDAWEWGSSCQDFKHAFLYACFAVQWGVNQYLAREESGPVRLNAIPPVPARIPRKVRDTPDQPVQLPRTLIAHQPREEFL